MEEHTANRENTAYHEAARVVAYLSLARPFIEVTIIPNEDLEGAVASPTERIGAEEFLDMEQEELNDEVFTFLVASAVDVLRGSSTGKLAGSDYEQAVEWAARSADPQGTLDEQWARAEQFVRDPLHHAQMEVVAQALLERERLTYNEVVELLGGME
jgi:ATP-dependent Zn protease